MVYDLTYRSAFSCQHFFLSSQLDQKAIFDSFHWLTELPPKALWLSVPPFFVFCSSVLFPTFLVILCWSLWDHSLPDCQRWLSKHFSFSQASRPQAWGETVVLPQPPSAVITGVSCCAAPLFCLPRPSNCPLTPRVTFFGCLLPHRILHPELTEFYILNLAFIFISHPFSAGTILV